MPLSRNVTLGEAVEESYVFCLVDLPSFGPKPFCPQPLIFFFINLVKKI